ncbi:MAG: hypothetical protein M1838_002424 [Thelocarpon superellum]|nr:MAG: hypothetical protein M1838_002424 [Thelocarpon superellum]
MPEGTQETAASTTNGADAVSAAAAERNGNRQAPPKAGAAAVNGRAAPATPTAASKSASQSSPDGADGSSKKRRKVNHGQCDGPTGVPPSSPPQGPGASWLMVVVCGNADAAILLAHSLCILPTIGERPLPFPNHPSAAPERPCTRCIKRNIGHLCHDEPREPAKKSKTELDPATEAEGVPSSTEPLSPRVKGRPAAAVAPGRSIPPVRTTATPLGPPPVPPDRLRPGTLYSGWSPGTGNQFQDMHTLDPSYMFNAPEVTNEYNLLNDFLSTSLLDDGSPYAADEAQQFYGDASRMTAMSPLMPAPEPSLTMGPATVSVPTAAPGASVAVAVPVPTVSRPPSTVPTDKAKETYYLTAADPSGSDPPEERMNKLLRAKYEAGLLKPFNYVKGYARLSRYMESHMPPASRQKILRQLDNFRPKFRERMQKLTDIELVRVEMWFERGLMEYDRVFASMAIPACCWRRTGEIFRGNREMAELIHVPLERFRDGKIAIHEILENNSIVSYWEKFGSIAFDNAQKAMLTSCFLKNPDPQSKDASIHCCFSFTIRRDTHNM